MKEQFINKKFNERSMQLITICDEIIERYQAMNLRLTLRMLYYQLVTTNAITNEERSYKNLSSLISDARLAGLLDWEAIEDRIRPPRTQNEWSGLRSLVDSALYGYRLPRWDRQPNYVELWVEKDALAGVLQPLARTHHVTMMVNRGYSSQSAMYDSGKRFQAAYADGKACTLLYLGDHDPSGEDMVRDIQDRLDRFGASLGADVQVTKIALTMAQVRQYNPPPNPAKVTDPRASGYITKYGNQSWEVDALRPEVLAQLINDAIENLKDEEAWNQVIEEENEDKQKLREAVAGLGRG